METKNFHSNLIVPADIDFAVAVRGYTFILMQEYLRLHKKTSYRIQQVIDELFINAVRYGSSSDQTVSLTYTLKDDILTIEVEDSGTGPHKIKAERLAEIIEQRRDYYKDLKDKKQINQALSGRGLPEIVFSWMDDIEFTNNERGGITVIAIKKVPNEQT